jgi:murein DD-endopeptidase MepM/ murein hydrolase activator NlpD
VSYLSILFSASSFTELLDYAMLISEVMEYHNGVIDALVATQNQLQTAKTELEDEKSEQEELKAQQESNKAELQTQEAEVDALITQIQALEADYQSELDEYEEESDRLSSSLKTAEAKYQKELEELEAKKKAEAAAAAAAPGANSTTTTTTTTTDTSTVSASGDWYWPLPGRYYISSSFAYRVHPITGKWSHHTGNDIPAPSGTSIHVAADGVVTEVGYSKVYGNYIRVSHGGGYATFYAHMKSTAIVSEGTTVSKGQVIGYVGTTGYSTGNHLHFELWINDERSDSLALYPNLTFTY